MSQQKPPSGPSKDRPEDQRETEKQRLDRLLNEGLDKSFPASDVVSVTEPSTRRP